MILLKSIIFIYVLSHLISGGLTWEKILEAFLKNPKSLIYLKKKIASNKEVFDLKNDIKKLLEEISYKMPDNNLLKGFVKELKKKIVEQCNKTEEKACSAV